MTFDETWPELWKAIAVAHKRADILRWRWHALDCISAPTTELRLATQAAYAAYAAAHAAYCTRCALAAERARSERIGMVAA